MRAWTELWVRLRALLGRGPMERELEEELAFHLERETEKHLARGLGAEAARREAYRRFGGVERHRERTREAWGVRGLEALGRDARLGLRRMARSPGFTAVATLTLALGIGGTVALLSVVHGLLVRPLPYDRDDGLVVLWNDWNWRGVEFDLVKERAETFQGVAAYTLEGSTLRLEGGAVPVVVGLASAEVFDVLGAPPLLGRTFQPGEDRPGAEPVVVVSHALWRQELGEDPDVVGRPILVDGVATTVIGVMPPEFYFPVPDVGAWSPLPLDADSPVYHGRGWLVLLGRLAPGVDDARVRADLDGLASALGERFTYPEAWDPTRDPHVRPLREYLLGDVRPVVLLLLGAVALLLLMATANVAALVLARGADRGTEMALRASLGAGRGSLVRQLLVESLLLAGLAGAAGATFAFVTFDLLLSRLPLRDGFAGTLGLDWHVFLGAMLLAALAGAAVALAPAWRLMGGGPSTMGAGARSESGGVRGRVGLQGALVAAEVAVAVVLVTGASLMARSVSRLYAVDVGLDPAGVGAVDLIVGGPEEMSAEEVEALLAEVVGRSAALPGVESAALTVRLPLRGDGVQGPMAVEDRPDLSDTRRPNAYWRPVTPDYFATLGIDLLEGRPFTEADRAVSPEVAIVSARFARDMWPGESALGKRIRPEAFEDVWTTVVGVAADVPVSGVRAAPPRVLYRPDAQRAFTWRGHTLVFRTAGDAAALLPAVREAVRRADARVAVARPTTMEAVVATSIGDVLQTRFFLTLLAGLALVVGSVGVYGVVSYSVGRRTSEYGIRMALGADGGRVVTGVLRREMVPAVAGVVGGLLIASLVTRAASGLLWELRPTDPVSLAAGAGVLLGAALLASLLPALRAASVSPATALRRE